MAGESAHFWDTLLEMAREEARNVQHKYVRSEHLLLALLRMPEITVLEGVQEVGITYATVAEQVRGLSRPVCAADEKQTLSANAERIVKAVENSDGEISRNLLRVLVMQSPLVRKLLLGAGVPEEKLAQL